MTEQEKRKIIELKEKGASFGFIAKELNLPRSTISTFYSSYLYNKDSCKQCGGPIKRKINRVSLFCCDQCRGKWWNAHKEKMNHKKVYTFVCQNCGVTFTRIQNKNYKYCSRECFRKARCSNEG